MKNATHISFFHSSFSLLHILPASLSLLLTLLHPLFTLFRLCRVVLDQQQPFLYNSPFSCGHSQFAKRFVIKYLYLPYSYTILYISFVFNSLHPYKLPPRKKEYHVQLHSLTFVTLLAFPPPPKKKPKNMEAVGFEPTSSKEHRILRAAR
ncbi:MAG: hypothetical protein JOS17DRAFT_223559 [Linnemannia elongata]|nr:MAG: hypothetical protein JOS17DRAFT_223559 [Linnemannia elongata]